MSHPPLVYAIIVNWNCSETIDNCLSSLFQSSYPRLEVVVVDNHSTDGSLERLYQRFDRIHYIKNERNVGFGNGANVGIRFALERLADYILLINPDAKLRPDGLEKLVSDAEKDPTVGLICPVILNNPGGQIWFSGGRINWAKMRVEHATDAKSDRTRTEFASGCTVLIKKNVFRKIGLFAQDYFLYYEDADFSVRASRGGFGIAVDPNIIVQHQEVSEQRGAEKTYWLVYSGLIFFYKNSVWLWKLWYRIYLPIRRLKNWLKIKKDPTNPTALAVRRAYEDFKQWKHNH